ncbi:unnamed protein product [Moneuplotes crassus]|uniref:Uncharacterized protein n=1 Tax=Euplotes crassus TaxID=5936 RepID=A0AAD1XN67_EUPCR|nr:unnamed protein product [Moneuplotes crassus]
MDQEELQGKIDQIYKVLTDLKKKHSKKKISWLMKISDKSFGLVEALVDNFMLNIEEGEYSTKILMILRQLCEYCPDLIFDQLLSCSKLPEALASYILKTPLEDMTPDAFLLITEFFKGGENLEILENNELVDKLFETLTIINKTHYFDAVVTILLTRFEMYCTSKDSSEEMNEETQTFIEKIKTHRSGRMFVETMIHLLNRRGAEGQKTIKCLSHLIGSERIYSNDLSLLGDILEDEIDKDATEENRGNLEHLLELVQQRKIILEQE